MLARESRWLGRIVLVQVLKVAVFTVWQIQLMRSPDLPLIRNEPSPVRNQPDYNQEKLSGFHKSKTETCKYLQSINEDEEDRKPLMRPEIQQQMPTRHRTLADPVSPYKAL